MIRMTVVEKEILKKYLKAPPVEMVLAFIEELDVSYAQFERFYGMYEGLIKNMKTGNKQLPIKHWAIIYEKIVPQYGTGYKKASRKKRTVSHKVSDRHPKTHTISQIKDIIQPS